MALTQRAKDWLATLARIPAVPTKLVEQRIRDAGYAPHPAWLDFQDNYAGYIEQVAPGDLAFWGLCHAATRDPPLQWVNPDEVFISPGQFARPEGIVCADAHPVHDYILLANGMFLGAGGPTQTFEQKVEIAGVKYEFYRRGKVEITRHGKDLTQPDNADLVGDMRPHFVPEASHKNIEYYMDATRLLVVLRKFDRLVLREVDPPSPP
jgi:hypothetical protein